MKSLRRAAAILTLAAFTFSVSNAEEVKAAEPLSWNASQVETLTGEKVASFHGKFINFVDAAGTWKEISLATKKDATGFHLTDAPYQADLPLRANGNIKFTASNRFDLKTKSIRDDAPVSMTKRFTDAVNVAGVKTTEGILYSDALPSVGASLLLQPHEMELRYLLKWDSLPTPCTTVNQFDVPFTMSFDSGLAPRKVKNKEKIRSSDETFSEPFGVSVNEFRGISIPTPHIWDSRTKQWDVQMTGKLASSIFTGAKNIDCSFFEGATYPVYSDASATFFPDPNVETTSFDGYVGNTNVAYATGQAAASGTFNSDNGANDILVQHINGGSDFTIVRAITLFDTSSLGASASISAATLSLYGFAANCGIENDAVRITVSAPASNTAIANGDYDKTKFTSTAQASDLNCSSITLSAYNDFVLNATGLSNIAKTGVTKFGVRSVDDINVSSPLGIVNTMQFAAAETAGTTSDPKLVVTYTTGGGARPIIILISHRKHEPFYDFV